MKTPKADGLRAMREEAAKKAPKAGKGKGKSKGGKVRKSGRSP
jgi:hypothetical protein